MLFRSSEDRSFTSLGRFIPRYFILFVAVVNGISDVQQSDSVIHMYILFHIFSIMVYHRILNIVPCSI